MSDNRKPRKVGYKNPPVHSRFKPGQSGNPKGRPRGSKNKRSHNFADKIADLILDEAHREIPVKENGKTVRVEVMQAAMRSVAANAIKGRVASQKLLFDLNKGASRHKDERQLATLEAAILLKEGGFEAFKEADKEGTPRPDIVPHPDDILIDPETGEVELTGPMTYSQRAREDLETVAAFEREIAAFEQRVRIARIVKCRPEIIQMYEDELPLLRMMLKRWKELYEAGQKSAKPDWTFRGL